MQDRTHVRRAFEEVMVEHLDALYRAALRFAGGRPEEAEDLLQDALLRGIQHWDSLREPDQAKPWLFRILVRTHLNRWRGQARRREQLAEDLDDHTLEAALARWRPQPTPESLARGEVQLARLVEHVDTLPGEWRQVFWLIDVEGFAHREVADMLSIPMGTVASRLHRGRARLAELLTADQRWNQWR